MDYTMNSHNLALCQTRMDQYYQGSHKLPVQDKKPYS